MTKKVTGIRSRGMSDGAALIEFDSDDGPVTLAFTEGQLPNLFMFVCGAIADVAEAGGGPSTVVLEPTGWEMAQTASGRLGVTFSLGSTELTFAVPMSQIEGAIQALQRMLAAPKPFPPGSRLH